MAMMKKNDPYAEGMVKVGPAKASKKPKVAAPKPKAKPQVVNRAAKGNKLPMKKGK